MISIAINEFEINKFDNISIIQSDASDYIKVCKDTFDLIIVDIFITDTIPSKFTHPDFIKSLISHLSSSGTILYNTMRKTMPRELFNKIKKTFSGENLEVMVLAHLEESNDLIIAKNNSLKIPTRRP